MLMISPVESYVGMSLEIFPACRTSMLSGAGMTKGSPWVIFFCVFPGYFCGSCASCCISRSVNANG